MNITVTNEMTEEVLGPFELSNDMKLMDLFALLDFREEKQALWHNRKELTSSDNEKTLEELGFADNDLLILRRKTMSNQFQGLTNDLSDDEFVEMMRNSLQHNPSLRSNMSISGVEHIINDRQMFKELLGPMLLRRRAQFQGQNPFSTSSYDYDSLVSNPSIPQNQMNEILNQREIDEQLRSAMEYTPEVFTSVHMLYINLEINGHPVKAFVDSGAQTTIMSTALAEITDLTKYIDKRFRGIAMGVGKGEIVGKIHTAQIKIESQYLPCSFTVLETSVQMLLGLDMLKRYQACIDLKHNVLKIANVETPFLPEHQIPAEIEASANSINPQSSIAADAEQNEFDKTASKTQHVPVTLPNAKSGKHYPDTVIKQLMDLGFSRSEVVKALDQTGGNPDYAAAFLFQ
ncbi:HFR009Cp [Eremothecium sinecaudum]|uniref:DNA damage-inducible protein 1 n=1 Tax=Eremothecium sinecaudum TaxID=45286 RepID=A0A0X8HUW4_9SACH|nr:HFR009Cp [Eremothecium sinecaudum]AMD21864.1 HFR009Cp [Eremothecium sinecaudum]